MIAYGRFGVSGVLAFATVATAQQPPRIEYRPDVSRSLSALVDFRKGHEQGGCELNGVNAIVMQGGGGIVVSNARNQQLCFFSADGRLLKAVGRRGSGPGEFQAMGDVSLYRGDSIVVSDPMLKRISVFGPRGEPGREFRVESPDTLGGHHSTVALANGEFLLGFNLVRTMAPQKDAVVFHEQFVRATPDGILGARVARVVQGEHFVQALDRNFGGSAYWSLQWGREMAISPVAAGFVHGDGGDNIVREYDPAGRIVTTHVLPLARQAITPEIIAAFKARELAAAKPARRAEIEKMVEEMPYPKQMPAFTNIIADPDGPVWVEQYPHGLVSPVWLRLDRTSRLAGSYQLPARFRLLAVRADRACGVGRDADDLETVYCFNVPKR
jgi:hypothetical protein